MAGEMTSIRVKAVRDIFTSRGHRIVREGMIGWVQRRDRPSMPSQWNKVPIVFQGRTIATWVDPQELQCDQDLSPYVLRRRPEEVLPLRDVPRGWFPASPVRNLRLFRKVLGWTQRELSRRICDSHVGYSTTKDRITVIETGKESLSMNHLQAIAEVMDIPVFAFFVSLSRVNEAEAFLKKLKGYTRVSARE